MSVTLPADGTVVATVTVSGAEQQIVQVSTLPAVALDGATLAALESISVANFPSTQPVSLAAPVALDSVSLAALESVSIQNFPATQPVSLAAPVALDSATLAALESITVQSAALPTGAATETTLTAISTKTPVLGQAAAAASSPVVLATDQSSIPANTLAQAGVARKIAALAAGSADTDVTLTTTCRRISMVATGSALRYAIGPTPQTASPTTHYIQMGERLDLAVPANSVVSALSDTATPGNLEITELL